MTNPQEMTHEDILDEIEHIMSLPAHEQPAQATRLSDLWAETAIRVLEQHPTTV